MENVMKSSQIDKYLTSIIIGQKSTNQIDGRKLVWFSHAVIDIRNIQTAFGWFLESFQTL